MKRSTVFIIILTAVLVGLLCMPSKENVELMTMAGIEQVANLPKSSRLNVRDIKYTLPAYKSNISTWTTVQNKITPKIEVGDGRLEAGEKVTAQLRKEHYEEMKKAHVYYYKMHSMRMNRLRKSLLKSRDVTIKRIKNIRLRCEKDTAKLNSEIEQLKKSGSNTEKILQAVENMKNVTTTLNLKLHETEKEPVETEVVEEEPVETEVVEKEPVETEAVETEVEVETPTTNMSIINGNTVEGFSGFR